MSKNLPADLLVLTKVSYEMLDFILRNCNGTCVKHVCLNNNQNANVGQNLREHLGVTASSSAGGRAALPQLDVQPCLGMMAHVGSYPQPRECQTGVKLQESS